MNQDIESITVQLESAYHYRRFFTPFVFKKITIISNISSFVYAHFCLLPAANLITDIDFDKILQLNSRFISPTMKLNDFLLS